MVLLETDAEDKNTETETTTTELNTTTTGTEDTEAEIDGYACHTTQCIHSITNRRR